MKRLYNTLKLFLTSRMIFRFEKFSSLRVRFGAVRVFWASPSGSAHSKEPTRTSGTFWRFNLQGNADNLELWRIVVCCCHLNNTHILFRVFIQDKLFYVQALLTADIPLHKWAPERKAWPLNGCAFLCDVMSHSELTTVFTYHIFI